MGLPTNVDTGMVTGRYIADIVDGLDPDKEPDVVPARGRIVFTKSVAYLPNPTAEPYPVTIMQVPIVAVLDEDGILCTPFPGTLEPQYRGVRLIATDDPDLAVQNWTWDVTYIFEPVNGHKLAIPPHGFALPSGETVDLTKVAKVPSSPGYSLPQAEAAVLRAEAIAQSIRDDADNGVFNGEAATLEIGSVTSGSTAEVVNVGNEQHAILNITLEKGDKGDTGTGIPAGGAPLQVVRKTSDGATTEWTDLNKTLVGLPNVDNTADADKPVSGPTATALAEKADKSEVNLKISKGDMYVNVKDYGAKGDGVTDDTAAWIAAEAAAFEKGPDYVLSAPYGLYRTSGQINIRCALDADQAAIRYYGTGTALLIGDESAPGKVISRRKFNLPRVINMSRGTNGWDGSSLGVKLLNLNTCIIQVPFIQDFEQGLVLSGTGAGIAYCTITLGALWDNHKNLVGTNDETGWVNQNLFLGGRLNQTVTKGAFLDDPNANQISMVSNTAFGGPNNNTFVNTSIEGTNVSYYRVDIAGRYNKFINCRWENFSTPCRIRYRESAEFNEIDGGYDASRITEVFDGTRGGGALLTSLGLYARANNTAGQSIPDSVYTDVTSWSTPTLSGVAYNSATGEFTPRPGRWMITATACFAPNVTGRRIMRLYQDAAVLEIAESPASASRETLKCVAVERFNGKQTFKMGVYQTSGGSLALEASVGYVKITANYLGQ